MKKAYAEIGFAKAYRYGLGVIQSALLTVSAVPPIRHFLLRLFGARIGRECVVHPIKFFNLYRTGFAGLELGDSVFVGDGCLFDLADGIKIEEHVSIGEGSIFVTHLKVGYDDHPLQPFFPAMHAPITLLRGTFLGAGVKLMPGVTIGPEAFVAAGSVVTKDVGYRELVGGVPARHIRKITAEEEPTTGNADRD